MNARKLNWRLARLSSRTQRATALAVLGVAVLRYDLSVCSIESRVRSSLNVRPSVAVLGFQNLSNQPSAEWLSTALTEMLSTELAAGGRLRTVPGELVSRVKLEMALPNPQTLTKPTLGPPARQPECGLRGVGCVPRVRRGSRHEGPARSSPAGHEKRRTGGLRFGDAHHAGAGQPGDQCRRSAAPPVWAPVPWPIPNASVRGSVPESAEAARNYSEGLERLRTFDTLGARELLRNAVNDCAGPRALARRAGGRLATCWATMSKPATRPRRRSTSRPGSGAKSTSPSKGRYFETTHAWDKAVVDVSDAAHRISGQPRVRPAAGCRADPGGRARGAPCKRIRSLRALPSGARDPRVDLAEAEALLAGSDLNSARDAAVRAAQSGAVAGYADPGGPRAPDRQPHRARIRRSAERACRRPHSRSSCTWRSGTGRVSRGR